MSVSNSASTQNVFSSSGGTVTGPVYGRSPIQLKATATAFTVKTNQSGSTFILPSVGAVITLPDVATCQGCVWKFILLANNGTTAWTITPATSVLSGVLGMGSTTTALKCLSKAAAANVAFTAANAKAGDWIEIVSEGTKFLVTGLGSDDASFA